MCHEDSACSTPSSSGQKHILQRYYLHRQISLHITSALTLYSKPVHYDPLGKDCESCLATSQGIASRACIGRQNRGVAKDVQTLTLGWWGWPRMCSLCSFPATDMVLVLKECDA